MKMWFKDKNRKKYYKSNQELNNKIEYKEEREFSKISEDTSPNILTTSGLIAIGVFFINKFRNIFKIKLSEDIKKSYIIDVDVHNNKKVMELISKTRKQPDFSYHNKYARFNYEEYRHKILYNIDSDKEIKYKFTRDILAYFELINAILDSKELKDKLDEVDRENIRKRVTKYLEKSIRYDNIFTSDQNTIYRELDNIIFELGDILEIDHVRFRTMIRRTIQNIQANIESDSYDNIKKEVDRNIISLRDKLNDFRIKNGPVKTIFEKWTFAIQKNIDLPIPDTDKRLNAGLLGMLIDSDDELLFARLGIKGKDIDEIYRKTLGYFKYITTDAQKLTYRNFLNKMFSTYNLIYKENIDLNSIEELHSIYISLINDRRIITPDILELLPQGYRTLLQPHRDLGILIDRYDPLNYNKTTSILRYLDLESKTLKEKKVELKKLLNSDKIKNQVALNKAIRTIKAIRESNIALSKSIIQTTNEIQADITKRSLNSIYEVTVNFLQSRGIELTDDYKNKIKKIILMKYVNINQPSISNSMKDEILNLIINNTKDSVTNFDIVAIEKEINKLYGNKLPNNFKISIPIRTDTNNIIKTIVESVGDKIDTKNKNELNRRLSRISSYANLRLITDKNIVKIYSDVSIASNIKGDVKYWDYYYKALLEGRKFKSVLNRPILKKSYNVKNIYTIPAITSTATIETVDLPFLGLKLLNDIVDFLFEDKASVEDAIEEYRSIVELEKKDFIKKYGREHYFNNIFSAGTDTVASDLITEIDEIIKENPKITKDELMEKVRDIGRRYVGSFKIAQYRTNNRIEQKAILNNIFGIPIRTLSFPYKIPAQEYDKFVDPKKQNIFYIGRTAYREIGLSLLGNDNMIYRTEQLSQMYRDTYLPKIIRQLPHNIYQELQKLDHFDPRSQATVKSIWNAFDVLKAKSEIQNPLIRAVVSPGSMTKANRRFLSKIGEAIIDYRNIYDDVIKKNNAKLLVFDVETFGLTSDIVGDLAVLQFDNHGNPSTYIGHAYSISFGGLKISNNVETLSLKDLADEYIHNAELNEKYTEILFKKIPILYHDQFKKQDAISEITGQILIREPIQLLYEEYKRLAVNPKSKEYKNFIRFLRKNVLPLQPTERMRTIDGFIKWLELISSDYDKYTVKYTDVRNMMLDFSEKGYIFGAYNKQFDISRMRLSDKRSIDLMYLFMAMGKTKDGKAAINFMQVKDLEFFRREYGITISGGYNSRVKNMFKSIYGLSDDAIDLMLTSKVITPEHFAPFDTLTTLAITSDVLSNRPSLTNVNSEYYNSLSAFGEYLSGLIGKSYLNDPSALLEAIRLGYFGYVTDGRPIDNVLDKILLPVSSESMAKGVALRPAAEQSISNFFFELSGSHKQLYQKFNFMFLRRIASKKGQKLDLSHLFTNPLWEKIIKENATTLGFSALQDEGVSDIFMMSTMNRVVYFINDMNTKYVGDIKAMAMGSGFVYGNPYKHIAVYSKYPEHLPNTVKTIMRNEGIELDFGENEELAKLYKDLLATYAKYNNAQTVTERKNIKLELIEKEKRFNEELNISILEKNTDIIRQSIRLEKGKPVKYGKLYTISAGSRIESITFDESGKVRDIVFYTSNDIQISNKTIKAHVGGQKVVLTSYKTMSKHGIELMEQIHKTINEPFVAVSLNEITKKQRSADVIKSLLVTSLLDSDNQHKPTFDKINNTLNETANYVLSRYKVNKKMDFDIYTKGASQAIKGSIDVNEFYKLRLLYELGFMRDSSNISLLQQLNFNIDVDKTMTENIYNVVSNAVEKDTKALEYSNGYRRFIYDVTARNYYSTNRYYTKEFISQLDDEILDRFINAYHSIYALDSSILKIKNRKDKIDAFISIYGNENGAIPKIVEIIDIVDNVKNNTKVAKQLYINTISETNILDVLDYLASPVTATGSARYRLNIDKDVHFLESLFRTNTKNIKGSTPLDYAKRYMGIYQIHREAAYAYNAIKKGISKISTTMAEDVRNNIFNYSIDIDKVINELEIYSKNNIDVGYITIDLTNKERREQELKKLGTLVKDFRLLEKAKSISGKYLKGSLPDVVYYNGSLITKEAFEEIAIEANLTPEEILTVLDDSELHSKNFILHDLPRGSMTPEEVKNLRRILNQKRKYVVNLKFEQEGKIMSISATMPHIIGKYNVRKGTYGDYADLAVEGINPDSSSFQIVATMVYNMEGRRDKGFKPGPKENALLMSKIISHITTLDRIVNNKYTEAAMISEFPLGFRGTATYIDPKTMTGFDDPFISVVNFEMFEKMVSSKEALKVLKTKEERNIIKNKVLFDPYDIIKLVPDGYEDYKKFGKEVVVGRSTYFSMTKENIRNMIEDVNEKRTKQGLSKINAIPVSANFYGPGFHGSFPLTMNPVPLRQYVVADDSIKYAQIGLPSFIRDVIFKDYDSDQVYIMLAAMTPEEELRHSILMNSTKEFKRELRKRYKFKLDKLMESFKNRDIIDQRKNIIDLTKPSDRWLVLSNIVGQNVVNIDKETILNDTSGDIFMNKLRLLFPDLSTSNSLLHIDDDGNTKEYFLKLTTAKLEDTPIVTREEIRESILSAIKGKQQIPRGYIVSRAMKEAISNIKEEGNLTDAQYDFLGRLSNIPGIMYELSIKAVKTKNKQQQDEFNNFLNALSANDKRMAKEEAMKYFSITAENQDELNMLSNVIDKMLVYNYGAKTTTLITDKINEAIKTRQMISLNKNVINNSTLDDVLSFAKGTHSNETINEFVNKTNSGFGSKLAKAFGLGKTTAIAAFIAGALTLSSLNSTAWYDSNIPGESGGELYESDVRWTYNNPVTFWQRDLNIKNHVIDNISNSLIMQQKIYLMKHKISKTDYLYVPVRNFKSKFLSL